VESFPLLAAGNMLQGVTMTLDPVFSAQDSQQEPLKVAYRQALQFPPPPGPVPREGLPLPMWRVTGGGRAIHTATVGAGEFAMWKVSPVTSTPFGSTYGGRGLVVSAPPEANSLFPTGAGSVLAPREALLVGVGCGWKHVPGQGFVPSDKNLDGRVPLFAQAKQALAAAGAVATKPRGGSGLVTVRLLPVGGGCVDFERNAAALRLSDCAPARRYVRRAPRARSWCLGSTPPDAANQGARCGGFNPGGSSL
jgi:hypothetical protein